MAGASQFFEGLFDFGELEVKFPQSGGVGFGEVGAQQVAAFSPPGFAQALALEAPAQGGALGFAFALQVDMHFDMACVASRVLARGTEGLVHGVAVQRAFAGRDGGEPIEAGAQPAAAHGAFLGDAILALGEDVGLAFLGQKFHAHAGPRLLPVASGEGGFEHGEFSFGRADQVAHGRVAPAHLQERLLGRAERSETASRRLPRSGERRGAARSKCRGP